MIFSPQVAITLSAEESDWLVNILIAAYRSDDEETKLDEKEAAFAIRLLDGFGVEPDDESAIEPVSHENKLH